MSDEIEIDLKNFGGPVYSGRAKGEQVRSKIKLDEIDSNATKVRIIVPENTFSLNSSFFLGLFGNSIRAAGSSNVFLEKFKFNNPPHIDKYITSGIERALLERMPLI